MEKSQKVLTNEICKRRNQLVLMKNEKPTDVRKYKIEWFWRKNKNQLVSETKEFIGKLSAKRSIHEESYGWHGARKEIYGHVIEKLQKAGMEFEETIIILKCSKEENRKRARKDGRDEIRIERGLEMTFSFYDEYDYPCIDTTELTPSQVAERVIQCFNKEF